MKKWNQCLKRYNIRHLNWKESVFLVRIIHSFFIQREHKCRSRFLYHLGSHLQQATSSCSWNLSSRSWCLQFRFLWQNPGREDDPPSSYPIIKNHFGDLSDQLFILYVIDEESEIQGGYDVFKILFVHHSEYIDKIATMCLNVGLEQKKNIV